MDTTSHEEEFGELRSLLQRQPDIAVFADVCEVITRMEARAPGVFADRYVDYAKEQLSGWPLRARTVQCSFDELEAVEATAWAPLVTSLMIVASRAPAFSEWRERLAVFPDLDHLGLFEFRMNRKEMFEAVDGGLFDGLSAVTFDDVNLNNFDTFTGIVERLSEREGCAGLSELAMRYAQLKAKHIEALCASALAPRLVSLDLSRNTSFKAAGVKALAAAAPKLASLERLGLYECGLTSTATKALAQACWPRPLSHVGLGMNVLKHNALKPLDKAGMLPALVDRQGAPSLDISSFDLDEAALELLIARGLFDGLVRFSCASPESMIETFAPLLAHEAAFDGLRHFRLGGPDIRDEDLASLMARMSLVELQCSFTEEEHVAPALSRHPDLKHLNMRRRGSFFGEEPLAEVLGRDNVTAFDEVNLYMLIPTDSPWVDRARAMKMCEVKEREGQMGVRVNPPVRDRGVRPLDILGLY